MDDKINTENEVAHLTVKMEREFRTKSQFDMHIANLQATGFVTTGAARNLVIDIGEMRTHVESLKEDIDAESKKAKDYLMIEVLDKGT